MTISHDSSRLLSYQARLIAFALLRVNLPSLENIVVDDLKLVYILMGLGDVRDA